MPVISGGNIISDPAQPDSGALTGGSNLRIARATYDFAVDGGAQGAINLLPAAEIPDNAIVMGGWLEVETVPTSGGAATIGLDLNATDDILAATVISGAPWSSTGLKDILPDI